MEDARVGVRVLVVLLLSTASGLAADHHIGGGKHGLGAVGGGFFYNGPPYWVTIGPNGLPVTIAPTAPLVFFVPAVPMLAGAPGLLGGPMPRFNAPRVLPAKIGPQPVVRPAPGVMVIPNMRPVNPAKGGHLVTIGDRLFRAGNLKRAEDRYEQARRQNPWAADPLVRLSQIALVRGQYDEAADYLRQAVAADPGWLAKARDIQAIYGEPGEFNRPVAKLESHLLADPTDRDGWLVLGAEYYLSGQTRRAADVFLRLSDRKPDAALAAFLDATEALPPDRD